MATTIESDIPELTATTKQFRRSAPLTLQLPSAVRIVLLLSTIVVILVALSTAGQISKYFLGHPRVKGLVPIFYVDLESNIPTWYSSMALALAGVLLVFIAVTKWHQRDPFRVNWFALASLFMVLSADEVAMFHEYPIDPLRRTLNAGGLLYYTWVLPGLLLVVATGVASLRFLWSLPVRTRWGMIMAGAIFVSGAILIEMVSGWQADHFGEETFTYAMIVTAEELFEMAGVVVIIYAIVDYINREMHGMRLMIGTPGSR